MNKIFTLIMLVVCTMSGTAQSAEDIVRKHFEVTGGLAEWNALNSIKIEGEVIVGVSDAVPIIIEHKRPYFKRVSYIIDNEELLNEGYDGKEAYTYDDADGGFRKLPGYKPDAFETDLLNYDKKGFSIALLGKEKVKEADAYKIKLTKNNIEDIFWIDANTYQLIKEQNSLETIYYSNFKKFGKLTFATKMVNQPLGGAEYIVLFNKIYPNASIAEKRFKFN